MFAKLREIEERFEGLEKDLSRPEIVRDQKSYQKLMKEHGSLSPVVQTYREYRALQEEIEGNRSLLEDPDPGMRKLAKEEIEALRSRLPALEEKLKIRKDIQANVEKVLMPVIYALLTEVPAPQKRYVELLRDNLMEITSPFIQQLTNKYHSLTPTEIGICNMIRTGLRSKEIAQTRGVSTATVSRHRERIRRKLGLANSDANLTTYLQTTM